MAGRGDLGSTMKIKIATPPRLGLGEKQMGPVAAGLDSDEVGIVTCRTATTWR